MKAETSAQYSSTRTAVREVSPSFFNRLLIYGKLAVSVASETIGGLRDYLRYSDSPQLLEEKILEREDQATSRFAARIVGLCAPEYADTLRAESEASLQSRPSGDVSPPSI